MNGERIKRFKSRPHEPPRGGGCFPRGFALRIDVLWQRQDTLQTKYFVVYGSIISLIHVVRGKIKLRISLRRVWVERRKWYLHKCCTRTVLWFWFFTWVFLECFYFSSATLRIKHFTFWFPDFIWWLWFFVTWLFLILHRTRLIEKIKMLLSGANPGKLNYVFFRNCKFFNDSPNTSYW